MERNTSNLLPEVQRNTAKSLTRLSAATVEFKGLRLRLRRRLWKQAHTTNPLIHEKASASYQQETKVLDYESQLYNLITCEHFSVSSPVERLPSYPARRQAVFVESTHTDAFHIHIRILEGRLKDVTVSWKTFRRACQIQPKPSRMKVDTDGTAVRRSGEATSQRARFPPSDADMIKYELPHRTNLSAILLHPSSVVKVKPPSPTIASPTLSFTCVHETCVLTQPVYSKKKQPCKCVFRRHLHHLLMTCNNLDVKSVFET